MSNKLLIELQSIHESIMFYKFINALHDGSNTSLLESIVEGYSVIFEEPHTITKDDKLVDLHVEDVLTSKYDDEMHYKEALDYVNELIYSIEHDQPLHIPEEIVRKGDSGESEETYITHPQESLYPWELKRILIRLYSMKDDFSKHIKKISLKGI